jgi:hypothetical protein
VSTTGIEREGHPISDLKRIVYNLDKDGAGFTAYLANNPNACLRRNNVLSPIEMGVGRDVKPLNKFREQSAFSVHDQRRFLGFSVADGRDVLGVIRLDPSRFWNLTDCSLLPLPRLVNRCFGTGGMNNFSPAPSRN